MNRYTIGPDDFRRLVRHWIVFKPDTEIELAAEVDLALMLYEIFDALNDAQKGKLIHEEKDGR